MSQYESTSTRLDNGKPKIGDLPTHDQRTEAWEQQPDAAFLLRPPPRTPVDSDERRKSRRLGVLPSPATEPTDPVLLSSTSARRRSSPRKAVLPLEPSDLSAMTREQPESGFGNLIDRPAENTNDQPEELTDREHVETGTVELLATQAARVDDGDVGRRVDLQDRGLDAQTRLPSPQRDDYNAQYQDQKLLGPSDSNAEPRPSISAENPDKPSEASEGHPSFFYASQKKATLAKPPSRRSSVSSLDEPTTTTDVAGQPQIVKELPMLPSPSDAPSPGFWVQEEEGSSRVVQDTEIPPSPIQSDERAPIDRIGSKDIAAVASDMQRVSPGGNIPPPGTEREIPQTVKQDAEDSTQPTYVQQQTAEEANPSDMKSGEVTDAQIYEQDLTLAKTASARPAQLEQLNSFPFNATAPPHAQTFPQAKKPEIPHAKWVFGAVQSSDTDSTRYNLEQPRQEPPPTVKLPSESPEPDSSRGRRRSRLWEVISRGSSTSRAHKRSSSSAAAGPLRPPEQRPVVPPVPSVHWNGSQDKNSGRQQQQQHQDNVSPDVVPDPRKTKRFSGLGSLFGRSKPPKESPEKPHKLSKRSRAPRDSSREQRRDSDREIPQVPPAFAFEPRFGHRVSTNADTSPIPEVSLVRRDSGQLDSRQPTLPKLPPPEPRASQDSYGGRPRQEILHAPMPGGSNHQYVEPTRAAPVRVPKSWALVNPPADNQQQTTVEQRRRSSQQARYYPQVQNDVAGRRHSSHGSTGASAIATNLRTLRVAAVRAAVPELFAAYLAYTTTGR